MTVVTGRADEHLRFTPLAPLLLALRSGPAPILDELAFAGLPTGPDNLVVLERMRAALEQRAIAHPLLAGDLEYDGGGVELAPVRHELGEEVVWRHELLRTAVYEALARNVRKALHHQAATVLADLNRPASVIARHLLLGAEPGDAAAGRLLSTAALEVARRDSGTALPLPLRALDLLPDDDDLRSDVVARAGELLLIAGKAPDAVELANRERRKALAPEARATIGLTLGRTASALAEIELELQTPDLRPSSMGGSA